MPEVDFYILSNTSEKAGHLFACKLAAEAYTKQQRMYICCLDQEMAGQLDNLLWSYDDISFIPHALLGTDHDEPPILIGCQPGPETHVDVLLNLNAIIPANMINYQRIIEIVTTDPDWKKVAREHYKAYQARNFPLKSHHQD